MIASIVYATEQGLGRLAWDFHENGLIQRIMIKHHPSRKNYYDWYPDRHTTESSLLDGTKTLLCFETPFYSGILKAANDRGVRTVLIPMYECTTSATARLFDVVINPSLLDQETFPWGTHIPIPVNVPFKLRHEAKVFVHNAGHGGLGGRNGTKELLEAMQYVKSPIKLIVRSQTPDYTCDDPRVTLISKEVPYTELWKEGDVFVFPEKFNGLSLPIQEAFASGMVVMATDRFPNNTYLPAEPLIPTSGHTIENLARPVRVATIDPKVIASKIDELYGTNITNLSRHGQGYATNNSWKKLKPRYKRILG